MKLEIYNATKRRSVCFAELAESFAARLCGLMFRRSMEPKHGMLIKFFFGDSSVHSFFMRFAIDLIFIDENRRVVEIAPLKPWRVHAPKQRCAFVLELAEGEARRRGVEVGDALEFREQ